MTNSLPWMRLWLEARNDKKLAVLTDRQHRIWFNLLLFAAEQETRGTIEEIDPFLLAIEVSGGDEEALIGTLETLGRLRIVDVTPCNALRNVTVTPPPVTVTFIHFNDRNSVKPSDAPERIRERVARYRARQKPEDTGTSGEDVTPRNAPVTRSNAVEESREEENIVVEEEAREAKTETPKDIPPQYQADMALRDRLQRAAESLSTKGVLTKAHRGKLDGWLAQYKKRLTVDMIDYAVEETAGHTGGDALDYFLKVIVNRIENPGGNKPPRSMNGKNGYAPPTGANLQSEVPPHGYSWDGGPGKWRKMEQDSRGMWPFGCRSFTEAQARNEEAEAQFYAAREEAPV
jgi:hypothetical protein